MKMKNLAHFHFLISFQVEIFIPLVPAVITVLVIKLFNFHVSLDQTRK